MVEPITNLEQMDNMKNILKKASRKAGIKENIGCHSMRKTFG